MYNNSDKEQEEIFSKVLRAGRRTYFFDVRETKASDYYLTITESKKFTNDDGTFYYKKHKIYLYKEDFKDFSLILREVVSKLLLHANKPKQIKLIRTKLKNNLTKNDN